MYVLKPGVKKDPVRRWALPDRIFFGHGACAILAGVFLQRQPYRGFYAERIIPGDGFAGNHIYATDGTIAFDYHSYSLRSNLLEHFTNGWSNRYESGWTCRIENVNFDLLSTADLNNRKMLSPDQYLGDPVGRAAKFIGRIDHSISVERAKRSSACNTKGPRTSRCEGLFKFNSSVAT
jgi:hypothetical protein